MTSKGKKLLTVRKSEKIHVSQFTRINILMLNAISLAQPAP